MDETKIRQLDSALVEAARDIKVLSVLSWPAGADEAFLQGWRKGDPQVPSLELNPPNIENSISELDSIASRCDPDQPIESFLAETAQSYADAGRMLRAVGTPEFTRYSVRIYGRPDTVSKLQGLSAVDGARFFLDVTDDLMGNTHIEQVAPDIPAGEFAEWLRGEADRFFEHDEVKIVVDANMSAKALAGANRIRVREDALFSQLDKDQLLFHEAFVHTATQLNGRKQANLKSLGLGAPRTTRTQEGIAVLAELITNAMDITRLRRVALRVIAVKMALDGADFIDLFKFFLEAGQPEMESVRSAQRVFRGGAAKDGIVFTKDAVYLQGLIEVHTFLRLAIRDNRPNLVTNLFAGRLTMGDALRLDPWFDSGWLQPPAYRPMWASDLTRTAALMAYSAFLTNIKLEKIHLERAIELEEELKSNLAA